MNIKRFIHSPIRLSEDQKNEFLQGSTTLSACSIGAGGEFHYRLENIMNEDERKRFLAGQQIQVAVQAANRIEALNMAQPVLYTVEAQCKYLAFQI